MVNSILKWFRVLWFLSPRLREHQILINFVQSRSVAKSVNCFILLHYISFQTELKKSSLQFGFKKNTPSASCTFQVQEIISYYNEHGSNVHCVMLDASKAFDSVRYHTLENWLILVDNMSSCMTATNAHVLILIFVC